MCVKGNMLIAFFNLIGLRDIQDIISQATSAQMAWNGFNPSALLFAWVQNATFYDAAHQILFCPDPFTLCIIYDVKGVTSMSIQVCCWIDDPRNPIWVWNGEMKGIPLTMNVWITLWLNSIIRHRSGMVNSEEGWDMNAMTLPRKNRPQAFQHNHFTNCWIALEREDSLFYIIWYEQLTQKKAWRHPVTN